MTQETLVFEGKFTKHSPMGTYGQTTVQRLPYSPLNQQFCSVRDTWHIEDIYTVGPCPTPDFALTLQVDLVNKFTIPFSACNLWPTQRGKPITPKQIARLLRDSIGRRWRRIRLKETVMIPSGSVLSAAMFPCGPIGPHDMVIRFQGTMRTYAL